MSLGSRIAQRGRAAVVASLASTPREPLLFLYPQWIRNSSTVVSEPAFIGDSSPSIPSIQYATPSSIGHNHNLATRVGKETLHDTGPSTDEAVIISPQHSNDELLGRNFLAEHHNQSMGTENNQIRNYFPKRRVNGARREDDPSSVQNRVRKIFQTKDRSMITADRERAIRQAYQTYRREKMRSWVPDWRVVLADLSKNTTQNEKWLEKALNIVVPESAVGQLLYGVDDNMWDIASRYACSVELTSRDPTTENYRGFLLSGPATAISKTTAEILRIAPNAELKAASDAFLSTGLKTTTSFPTVDFDGEEICNVKARHVRSERRRAIPPTRADRVPRPSEWTVHTFADYVEDLTSIEVPNHLHRLMYKRGEGHVEAVLEILRKIFKDPECRSSVSRTAFNTAIAYFVKTNHIEDARVFFVHMDMMKIQMDPETFNILLRGAAKSEDLHNFHFVLHLMLRRGFLPNSKTWIAFLMAVPDLRIKLYILAAMKERGLLRHTSTLKAVCEQLVSQEIIASLDQGQNQKEFLHHMDSRYGKNWLTVSSGNQVIHALGGRGLMSRCWEFLLAMDARYIQPDHVSINTILNHCKQAGNVAGAIEIMKSLPPSLRFVPDEMTYHALFEIAWRSRSHNLARVVWRYACLNAGTTRRMRTFVFQSLYNAAFRAKPDPSQRKWWGKHAGLVIAGINRILDHPMTAFHKAHESGRCDEDPGFELEPKSGKLGVQTHPAASTLSAEIEEPVPLFRKLNPEIVASEISRVESSISSAESEEVSVTASHVMESSTLKPGPVLVAKINKLLEREYEVFRSWVPRKPFVDMLVEAWEQDQEWKKPQIGDEAKQLRWKLDRAIAVPLRTVAVPGRDPFDVDWK